MIGVRIHDPLLSRVDQWISENQEGDKPLSRPEGIRRMLDEYLASYGLPES